LQFLILLIVQRGKIKTKSYTHKSRPRSASTELLSVESPVKNGSEPENREEFTPAAAQTTHTRALCLSSELLKARVSRWPQHLNPPY
jgi:hypothetical protein